MSKFSNNLKNIRIKKKIKQIEIADYLNVGPRAIRFYESGDREPSFDKLVQLADYFDVSTDYLLGRTDNPNSHKN